MSLKGRAALVTGSTSGIGLGIARALAAEGADIMLNGFGDPAPLLAEFAALGIRVLHDPADLTRPDAVAALVARTQAELGGLDILVNNAGIQHTATIAAFPPAKWEQVIGLNLSAPFYAMQAAIPGMTAKGWGRIINIASAHGLVGSAAKSAYVAAKHGLVGLTKVGAIELANTGITVNAICPGWVLTPLVQAQIDARAAAGQGSVAEVSAVMLGEKQPMQQFTTPEGIGGLAVFLCSEAARTITGAPLPIDGGWVAT
ncbi:MAG: 3-hydroxybutyrate dehydrogenase [Janthinobacterium lividum]